MVPRPHVEPRARARAWPWRWGPHALALLLVAVALALGDPALPYLPAPFAAAVLRGPSPARGLDAPGSRLLALDPAGLDLAAWEPSARLALPALDPFDADDLLLVERIARYRVAPGDTLYRVADRFGVSPETLLWANAFVNPDRLVPGQELTVLPVSGVTHTVGEDETLEAIAARYSVEVGALAAANGLAEPYALRAGDRLLVPGGSRPAPQSKPTVTWPEPGSGARYRQQFVEAAVAVAQETRRRYGVPASVTIAMAINETGWGSSRLAREAHNYFGIKGRNSEGPAGVVWMNTWEVLGGRNLVLREPFRAYHDPEESFYDYGLFFRQNRRYQAALAVADDPRAFIRAIAAAGFATDPDYAAKIIRMMDQLNLYQYDLP